MNVSRIALVDMDGTVCDFDGALKRDLRLALLNTNVSAEVKENVALLIRKQPGWWRHLEPLKLGIHIVRRLQEIGFDITILTKGPSRATNAWTEKVEWCARHLPLANVTITQDKGLVYGRVLVDDWPPYIKSWLEFRPRGLVIMPAHSWNQWFKHPNVHRVSSKLDVDKMHPLLVKAYNR
jgi:5'(3')-deoxyribonucleotidase